MSCVPIFAHFFTFSSRVNDNTTVLAKFQIPCIVDFNSLQESSNFPPVTPYYAYFILQSWNTPRMTKDLE